MSSDTMTGRAFRYGIAGLAATAIYLGVVTALVELGALSPVAAAAVATGVVIVFSYNVNRAWIFPTNRSHLSAFSRFALASGLSIALNTGLMHLAVDVLAWHYWTGLVLATAVVPPTNFLVNQYWSFRPRS
jgi:putative flippase GtrA